MANPILSFLSKGFSGVVSEVGNVIDKLHTSEAEKLEAKRKRSAPSGT